MLQIYFKYEENTHQYVYGDGAADYKMPLPLMLKLKKYYRENLQQVQNLDINQWLQSLTQKEQEQVDIVQKHSY